MQPSVKKGENLHFFNFSEVGINGGKHRLNQCRNWGYYDGGLNANFGIRDKSLHRELTGIYERDGLERDRPVFF
jgi:hypothetical protein